MASYKEIEAALQEYVTPAKMPKVVQAMQAVIEHEIELDRKLELKTK